MDELQAIKDEVGTITTRLDNIEGYFSNFNTTLDNHMADYKVEQAAIKKDLSDTKGMVTSLEDRFNLGFWIIFSLLTLVLGGIIGGMITLLVHYLDLIKGGPS